jgi:16S rRNA (uracil1498-N3)-methyltransferase
MQRLYITQNLEKGKPITIKDNDFHYLKNVMRIKPNDNILLYNQSNGEFLSNITEILKKEIIITPTEQTRKPSDEKINDTEIIFSIIKPQRIDLIIEKTTELGVKELSPIITQYTNNKHINIERLNTIAKEASEQSRRLSIPQINEPTTLHEKLKNFNFEKRTLIYLDERPIENNTTEILKKFKGKPISFLIGPEGGFSNTEFELLRSTPAIGITLGKQILRAETATISIISLYNLGI